MIIKIALLFMVDTRSTKPIPSFWDIILQHPKDALKNAGGLCVALNHPTIQSFFGAVAITTTTAVACVYIVPNINEQHLCEIIDTLQMIVNKYDSVYVMGYKFSSSTNSKNAKLIIDQLLFYVFNALVL